MPSPQPGLSEPARLINTFFAPGKTFADLNRKPSWWVPWLLSSLFGLIFAFIAVQKLDIPRLVEQGMESNKMAQQRMSQLSPEQRERAMASQVVVTKVVFFFTPVFALLGGLLLGLIFWLTFSFGFAAEITYSKALAIVFYSFLPRIIYTILVSISMVASPDPNGMDFLHQNPIPTNPGFFLDPNSSKFLYTLASGLDIFAIWTAVLIGLGFSICSASRRVRPSTGITIVLGAYVFYVLIHGGLAAAF